MNIFLLSKYFRNKGWFVILKDFNFSELELEDRLDNPLQIYENFLLNVISFYQFI